MTTKSLTASDFRRAVLTNPRPGISTAEFYIKQLADSFGQDNAAKMYCNSSNVRWGAALKQARSDMTFHQKGMDILPIEDMNVDESTKIDKGACAEYEAIIGTRDKDWDGDIVEPNGYDFDMKSPVLWMHAHGMPVGAIKSVVERTDDMVRCRFKVADTALGRDAVALMKVGALRKSIGFKPVDGFFDPISYKRDPKSGKDVPSGWHVKRCKIMENSLVSVPANPNTAVTEVFAKSIDAIRTLSGNKAFNDERVAYWAKSFDEGRAAVVRGWTKQIETKSTETAETQPTKASEFGFKTEKYYGIDEYMPLSMEDRIEQVTVACRKYATANNLTGDSSYGYVIATYSEMAIFVVKTYGNSQVTRKLYQMDYSIDGMSQIVIGKHVEINITPVITAVGGATADGGLSTSAITTKIESIEKSLNIENMGKLSMDAAHEECKRSLMKKAIAELMIGDTYDASLVTELRDAAESFERLVNVKSLRALGLTN